MTVNAVIGNHVSPFCPHAHRWRATSADNLAVRRASERGPRQEVSTTGKYAGTRVVATPRRDDVPRGLSRTRSPRGVRECRRTSELRAASRSESARVRAVKERDAAGARRARLGGNRSRLAVSAASRAPYRPVGIRSGAERVRSGGDVTASAPPSGRPRARARARLSPHPSSLSLSLPPAPGPDDPRDEGQSVAAPIRAASPLASAPAAGLTSLFFSFPFFRFLSRSCPHPPSPPRENRGNHVRGI